MLVVCGRCGMIYHSRTSAKKCHFVVYPWRACYVNIFELGHAIIKQLGGKRGKQCCCLW